MDKVINEIGKDKLEAVFTSNQLEDLFENEFFGQVIDTHFSGKKNNTYQIFQLLFLSYWYKHFIVESNYEAG